MVGEAKAKKLAMLVYRFHFTPVYLLGHWYGMSVPLVGGRLHSLSSSEMVSDGWHKFHSSRTATVEQSSSTCRTTLVQNKTIRL